jgi:hypothetical protein
MALFFESFLFNSICFYYKKLINNSIFFSKNIQKFLYFIELNTFVKFRIIWNLINKDFLSFDEKSNKRLSVEKLLLIGDKVVIILN